MATWICVAFQVHRLLPTNHNFNIWNQAMSLADGQPMNGAAQGQVSLSWFQSAVPGVSIKVGERGKARCA